MVFSSQEGPFTSQKSPCLGLWPLSGRPNVKGLSTAGGCGGGLLCSLGGLLPAFSYEKTFARERLRYVHFPQHLKQLLFPVSCELLLVMCCPCACCASTSLAYIQCYESRSVHRTMLSLRDCEFVLQVGRCMGLRAVNSYPSHDMLTPRCYATHILQWGNNAGMKAPDQVCRACGRGERE